MKRIYIAGLTYPVGLAICYVYGRFNQSFARGFPDVIFPVTSGFAVLIVFLFAKKYGFSWRDRFGRMWLKVLAFHRSEF